MITEKEIEMLAEKVAQEYVIKCGCNGEIDVVNAINKLVTVCGLAIFAMTGNQNYAVKQLERVVAFIGTPEANKLALGDSD